MNFIAFYLPQFYPIPENDRIYGPGFTEWDNVRRAKPLLPGHYEPHIPHKRIGYYSLLDDKFLQAQHNLAWAYGLTGFCYYYYDFSGHKLLDRPLRTLHRTPQIPNNFCLCWVHTSWYNNRHAPTEPFIAQEYSEENAVRLFFDLINYWQDTRYIKIAGRPLFLIWAPERHPMLATYAAIWRSLGQKHAGCAPYLAGVEAYMANRPAAFGLDAMIEFAPAWARENHVSELGEQPVRIDYAKTINLMLKKPKPDYLRLRCTFPSWDNTPRRGREGIACVGATPELFKYALEELALYTKENLPTELAYIFINAWNEWGEGCHLEPCERYGFTYLKIIKELHQALNN
ncbi:MAG: glycoside hydrolase family 99-like domain-containing protein [Desulfovibrionaceae bacterium]|nr:glycoside hydrolase family 99-like domain-containing protein [Desulfovibrionaceae bacterium]